MVVIVMYGYELFLSHAGESACSFYARRDDDYRRLPWVKMQALKDRHPELRPMRARSLQRPNRSEGTLRSFLRFHRLAVVEKRFRKPVSRQISLAGFMDSTSLFFYSLRHPLICFSRAMAPVGMTTIIRQQHVAS
jgi:hypothetical protein